MTARAIEDRNGACCAAKVSTALQAFATTHQVNVRGVVSAWRRSWRRHEATGMDGHVYEGAFKQRKLGWQQSHLSRAVCKWRGGPCSFVWRGG